MFIETFRRNFNCNTINKPALTMPPDAFCHSRFTVVSNLCVFYLSVFFQQLFLRNKNRILISSEKYIPLSQAIILASSCFWNEMNKKKSHYTWNLVECSASPLVMIIIAFYCTPKSYSLIIPMRLWLFFCLWFSISINLINRIWLRCALKHMNDVIWSFNAPWNFDAIWSSNTLWSSNILRNKNTL